MKRVLLAILAGGICSAQTPPQVKVEGGLLHGDFGNGLSVYRGIPFAGRDPKGASIAGSSRVVGIRANLEGRFTRILGRGGIS
jgi:hypothetical protein